MHIFKKEFAQNHYDLYINSILSKTISWIVSIVSSKLWKLTGQIVQRFAYFIKKC